jgi:hypothetical protein
VLSNYQWPTQVLGNVGKITPAALLVKVNNSSSQVTQDASLALDTGLSYEGLVSGESAANVLTGTGSRTYLHDTALPAVGTYSGVYGLSAAPVALHGNYTVTVQNGDLTDQPAQRLLIVKADRTVMYGDWTAAHAGASAQAVTASYCLSNDCASSAVALTVHDRGGGLWRATDPTGTELNFSTGIDSTSKTSSGGFVNVGHYTYSASPTQPPVVQNFSTLALSGAQLTVQAKALSLEASGVKKTYDGNSSLAGIVLQVTGRMPGDEVGAASAGGSFDTKNAGEQGFSLSGLSLAGADRGNYAITMSELTGRGQIERKELSLVPRSVSKVYDGSTGYTMTAEDLNHLSSQLEAADLVTQATMSFANSQVSRAADGSVLSNKAVQLEAVTIDDGNQGGNYQLVLQGNATSLISPKALTVSAIAAGQSTYGEAVSPGAVSLQGVLVGDQVNATASLLQVLTSSSGRIRAGVYQQGTNPDLLGKDAGNYSLTGFSTVTPNFEVTPRVIQSSAVVQDKVYDGNSQATLASLDSAGVLQGDALSMSSGEVRFADKNVSRDANGQVQDQAVTVHQLSLAGADASNYQLFASSFTTQARILPRGLSVQGSTVADKTHDGKAMASVSVGTVSGFVGDERLGVVALGEFDSPGVGVNKAVWVRYSLSDGAQGGLAVNYELPAQVLTASILAKQDGRAVQVDDVREALLSAWRLPCLETRPVTLGESGSPAESTQAAQAASGLLLQHERESSCTGSD